MRGASDFNTFNRYASRKREKGRARGIAKEGEKESVKERTIESG